MFTMGESSRRCGGESELFGFALGYSLGCFKVPGLARVRVTPWPPASWLQGRLLVESPSVHNQVMKHGMFLVQNGPHNQAALNIGVTVRAAASGVSGSRGGRKLPGVSLDEDTHRDSWVPALGPTCGQRGGGIAKDTNHVGLKPRRGNSQETVTWRGLHIQR